MSTSATDGCSRHAVKTALWYLLAALAAAFFGAVYEQFSHSVYSNFMLYAFAFPLAGGTLPFLVLSMKPGKQYPSYAARTLWHMGIATLTVGSVVRGVLEIYGTTNSMAQAYWWAGAVLLAAALAAHILQQKRR